MTRRLISFVKNNFSDLLVTFIIVYFSNDTLLFGTNESRIMFWIHIGVLGILGLYLFLTSKVMDRRHLLLLLFFAVLILLSLIANLDLSIKYIYEIIVITISLLLIKRMMVRQFSRCFCAIFEFLSFFSILMFIIILTIPGFVSFLPSITNESGIVYKNALFCVIEGIGESGIPHMYGIFREPGVFAVFIAVAFLLEILFADEISYRRIIIFSVALLITFSTAGYLLLLMLIVLLMVSVFRRSRVNKRDYKRFLVFVFIAGFLAVAFIGFIGFSRINEVVFNKLRVENSSFNSRVGSIFANIDIFLTNPFTGRGFTFVEKNFSIFAQSHGYSKAHQTNTFLKILAVHGAVYFLVVAYSLLKFFVRNSKDVLSGIFGFLVFLIAFSNEDLMVNSLVYVIICYGFFSVSKAKNIIAEKEKRTLTQLSY